MGGAPDDYCILLEEIASHGYVVLNLHHYSSSGSVPSGEKSIRDKDSPPSELAESQAANIQFVTEQIRSGQFNILSQKLDHMNPIIVAGHSLGGAASVIAARNRSDYVGCILVDGGLQGEDLLKTQGILSPLLLLCTKPPQEEWALKMQGEWRALLANTPNSYGEQINGIVHGDFSSFNYIAAWLVGAEKDNPNMSIQSILKAHEIASKRIVEFANYVS
jgi:dienelactone hydrolase